MIGDTVEATRAGRKASRSSGTPRYAKAAPFNSEKAKDEYARNVQDPARRRSSGSRSAMPTRRSPTPPR